MPFLPACSSLPLIRVSPAIDIFSDIFHESLAFSPYAAAETRQHRMAGWCDRLAASIRRIFLSAVPLGRVRLISSTIGCCESFRLAIRIELLFIAMHLGNHTILRATKKMVEENFTSGCSLRGFFFFFPSFFFIKGSDYSK